MPLRTAYVVDDDATVKLTLTHEGLDGDTATAREVGGGWPRVLSSLKSLLETGTPLDPTWTTSPGREFMSRNVSRLVLTVLVLAACATASPREEEAAMPKKAAPEEGSTETVFAVRFHPGAKWLAGKSPMEQPGIQEHVKNLGGWAEAGKLWLGGPFLHSTGGLAVLRVASIEEAKKLAESDPCVTSGLMTSEVHPWLVAFEADDDEEEEDEGPAPGAR